jgi:hypothetical protein
MASFLVSHELNEESVTGCQASSSELLLGESSQDAVEEIQLNPLLVQAQKNGLVIEIGLNAIDGLSAVGAETTTGWYGIGSWLSNSPLGL